VEREIWTTNTNDDSEECCLAEYDAMMTFRGYVFSIISTEEYGMNKGEVDPGAT